MQLLNDFCLGTNLSKTHMQQMAKEKYCKARKGFRRAEELPEQTLLQPSDEEASLTNCQGSLKCAPIVRYTPCLTFQMGDFLQTAQQKRSKSRFRSWAAQPREVEARQVTDKRRGG